MSLRASNRANARPPSLVCFENHPNTKLLVMFSERAWLVWALEATNCASHWTEFPRGPQILVFLLSTSKLSPAVFAVMSCLWPSCFRCWTDTGDFSSSVNTELVLCVAWGEVQDILHGQELERMKVSCFPDEGGRQCSLCWRHHWLWWALSLMDPQHNPHEGAVT